MPENEISERSTRTRMDARQFPRHIEHEHLVSGVSVVGQGNRRGIKPGMRDKFGDRLRTPSTGRSNAIRLRQ